MVRLHIQSMLTSFISILPLCLLAQNFPQDYLRIHNDARAMVGVPPLLWDSKLESYANSFVMEHVADCAKGKDIEDDDNYSRNIAINSTPKDFTGADAVELWVSLKPFYDYESNSCIGGMPCFLYTQVVSRASIYLGCATIKCQNGGTLVTCYYDPPGSVFRRPY
ncbi:hypothetical protein PIB30_057804 [Stylosanthes scabra]|uniref:SCP domain-containing protein n=1 Tax=Stylosanthes scabra TaxID=79078 RepID=A0ABU6XHR5_9FABA|nr:hypothetical protein [Stylosanthes scabra]